MTSQIPSLLPSHSIHPPSTSPSPTPQSSTVSSGASTSTSSSANPSVSSPQLNSLATLGSPYKAFPGRRSLSSGSNPGSDNETEKGDSSIGMLHRPIKANIDIPRSSPERNFGERRQIPATTIVPIWILLSSTVIIYNKYLYTNLDFPYPVFITAYHLGCAAIGTRILRATTHLMDGLDNINMTRDLYVRSIIPIGVLFSGSLILSNSAYLTLSVSFIQMLKAATPVCILLISAIFGIQKLNERLVIIVVLISVGCALAAYGELHFEMFGFLCQSSAVIFEASRLVMIQILLQGLKMDPLCSLHYYAPVCAIINSCFIPFTEGFAPFQALSRIGPFILLTNAGVAFALNIAAVFLIGAAGGLVLTLAGVFKDILLISSSCIFFGSKVTSIQIFGYSLALGGLVAYKSAASK